MLFSCDLKVAPFLSGYLNDIVLTAHLCYMMEAIARMWTA